MIKDYNLIRERIEALKDLDKTLIFLDSCQSTWNDAMRNVRFQIDRKIRKLENENV